MAYRIVERALFLRDLESIVSYLALNLKNPVAADALLDSFDDRCDDLEQMPLMYGFCEDPYLREHGYHKVGVRNYIIVYKVYEEEKTVHLLRMFHGKQDYEKLI